MTRFIPFSKPCSDDEEISAVCDVIRSGWWTTGPAVFEFEKKVIEFLGDESLQAVALNSCTAALFLALKALGVGPGDVVAVPTVTYVATAHVVEWCGAELLLCDIDYDTLCISLESLKKYEHKNIKVVMPVHMAGLPCDMEPLMQYCRDRGIKVVEDAAHSFGAKDRGIQTGAIGDAGAFSFYATKVLACGEGGMLVSRNRELIERARKLSYFGIDKRAFERYTSKGTWYYEVEDLGYKFNMDSIHAALGIVQLKKQNMMLEKRTKIASYYDKNLPAEIVRPFRRDSVSHVWHLYPVKLPEGVDRDQVFLGLREKGIGTSVHFIPLHRHPYYSPRFVAEHFPNAEKNYASSLSLPLHAGMSIEDAEYVISSIRMVLGSV
ncbi:MAG: DegT/DnrJ/EryC1/StrS aminotransferase family protein [Candidatus Cloacimonetes bacterium]|nr:DegT/DnrJ/EryC1/StrS aminotransferase family protein [Candidatus Cloacimonadota bacterium]